MIGFVNTVPNETILRASIVWTALNVPNQASLLRPNHHLNKPQIDSQANYRDEIQLLPRDRFPDFQSHTATGIIGQREVLKAEKSHLHRFFCPNDSVIPNRTRTGSKLNIINQNYSMDFVLNNYYLALGSLLISSRSLFRLLLSHLRQ